MSASAVPQAGIPWRRLSPVAPPLAAGLVLIAVLFAGEIGAAVTVWRGSTAYGHCWLVLPIALWLLWERRHVLRDIAPRPAWWACLLALPLSAAWAMSFWLGIMEGRQLAAVGFLLLLLLAVLGPRLWWGWSPGFLYLLFLVPFGAFLTTALQNFTASFVIFGLDFLRIPYEADSYRITIPEGVFYVAEACAGLRFLIASIAFGVLYAVTIFRSPLRRLIFIAVACVLPVVANGIRGLGIVVLGHVLGSAQAAATDHVLYGWIFFSIVIVLLAASGLPFREDLAPATIRPYGVPAPQPRTAWFAAIPVLAAAVLGPALVLAVGGGSTKVPPAWKPQLTIPANCTQMPAAQDEAASVQQLDCGDGPVVVTAAVLPQGANPAHVLDAARRPALAALGGDVDTGRVHIANAEPSDWVLLTDRDSGRVAAYVLWVDGKPALGGLHDRLHMARDMFAGSVPPPASLTVAAPSETALATFLTAQTGLRVPVSSVP